MHNELKGQSPVGFLVLKKGIDRDPDEIVREVVQMVRQKIGPVAAFRTAIVVAGLPKSSGSSLFPLSQTATATASVRYSIFE